MKKKILPPNMKKLLPRLLVPWENLFPEYSKEELPGIILAGSRIKEGLTQKQLSDMTGISRTHISEMENGRRPIEKETAKILGQALNVGYKVFHTTGQFLKPFC